MFGAPQTTGKHPSYCWIRTCGERELSQESMPDTPLLIPALELRLSSYPGFGSQPSLHIFGHVCSSLFLGARALSLSTHTFEVGRGIQS